MVPPAPTGLPEKLGVSCAPGRPVLTSDGTAGTYVATTHAWSTCDSLRPRRDELTVSRTRSLVPLVLPVYSQNMHVSSRVWLAGLPTHKPGRSCHKGSRRQSASIMAAVSGIFGSSLKPHMCTSPKRMGMRMITLPVSPLHPGMKWTCSCSRTGGVSHSC